MQYDKGSSRPYPRTCALLLVALTVLACTPEVRSDGPPTAIQVLEESNQYHDPDGTWFSSTNRVLVRQLRPGVGDRIVDFTLYPASDQFEISMREDADSVAGSVSGTVCDVPDSVPASATERFGSLDCDGVLWWRGYYSYQFSSPMHLNDGAATVDSSATVMTFLGEPVYSLRVTYGPGQPVWDYYFDRHSFMLKGARFSSDGLGNDGEYIAYAGETASGRVRLPSRRSWYMNADSSSVGEDVLVELQSSTPDG
jgi:hypothetical protein